MQREKVDTQLLKLMTTKITHRGPDDEGFVLIDSKSGQSQSFCGNDSTSYVKSKYPKLKDIDHADIGFGFRRLSILDLTDSGHQPMSIENGNYWIVFNGEVFNYLELKTELKQAGIQFFSNSDTEVILQAYKKWGQDCVKRFNGMWAFSIWDNLKKELFCSRDRFGIKPFYFVKQSNSFIWASEIKQLIPNQVNPSVNYEVVYNFLRNARQNISNQTFINGITELKPGHNLVISSDYFNEYQYWHLTETSSVLNETDSVNRFLDLLTDSITLRLRSDVPVGITLSGGLDSSTIACIAAKHYPDKIHTFSVYYEDDKKYDERAYISEVLKSERFIPTYFTSSSDVSLDEIEKMVYYHDQPSLGASPYSSFENHRNISKSGIKVVLNGQGADELLAGYHYYFKYYYLELVKKFKFVSLLDELKQTKRIHEKTNQELLNTLIKILFRLIFPDSFMKRLESFELSTSTIYSTQFQSYRTKINLENKFRSPLANNLFNTLTYSSIPHLLHWEDRNSMAHSVESRVPFLDYRLVEFMFQLDSRYKINKGITKSILRDATKGILPEKIRTRQDKIGFATPTDNWVRNREFQSYIFDTIHSSKFKERGIYKTSELESAIRKNELKSNELWRIITLEMWFQLFIEGK